jgi:hypothetical protein
MHSILAKPTFIGKYMTATKPFDRGPATVPSLLIGREKTGHHPGIETIMRSKSSRIPLILIWKQALKALEALPATPMNLEVPSVANSARASAHEFIMQSAPPPNSRPQVQSVLTIRSQLAANRL